MLEKCQTHVIEGRKFSNVSSLHMVCKKAILTFVKLTENSWEIYKFIISSKRLPELGH